MEPNTFNLTIPPQKTENDAAIDAVHALIKGIPDLPKTKPLRDFTVTQNFQKENDRASDTVKSIMSTIKDLPVAQPSRFDVETLIQQSRQETFPVTAPSLPQEQPATTLVIKPLLPGIKKVLRAKPVVEPKDLVTITESLSVHEGNALYMAGVKPTDFRDTVSLIDFSDTASLEEQADNLLAQDMSIEPTQAHKTIIETITPSNAPKDAQSKQKTFLERITGWMSDTPKELPKKLSPERGFADFRKSLTIVTTNTETLRAKLQAKLAPSGKRLLSLLDQASIHLRTTIPTKAKMTFYAGIIALAGLTATKNPLEWVFEKLTPASVSAAMTEEASKASPVDLLLQEQKTQGLEEVKSSLVTHAHQESSSKTPESPLLFHTVKQGENLWSILRAELTQNTYTGYENFTSLSGTVKEEKIKEIIRHIEKDPKAYGFSSGNISLIRPGNVLDFTTILKK